MRNIVRTRRGKLIRFIRLVLDLSQIEFAKLFNVCETTMVIWERKGPSWVTLDQLIALRSVGINPMYLADEPEMFLPGVSFDQARQNVLKKINEDTLCKKTEE